MFFNGDFQEKDWVGIYLGWFSTSSKSFIYAWVALDEPGSHFQPYYSMVTSTFLILENNTVFPSLVLRNSWTSLLEIFQNIKSIIMKILPEADVFYEKIQPKWLRFDIISTSWKPGLTMGNVKELYMAMLSVSDYINICSLFSLNWTSKPFLTYSWKSARVLA